MLLLDTNVVSEIVNGQPDPAVAAFIRSWKPEDVFLPSLVVAEIRYGLRRNPPGRKTRDREHAFETFLRDGFSGRVVPFDAACATSYAAVRAIRDAAGRPVSLFDALIGGTALAHGAVLATRNVRDFDGYGLQLVNPWEGA